MDKEELIIIKENELISIVDSMNFKLKQVCKNEGVNFIKIKDVFLEEETIYYRIMFVIDGESEGANFVFLDEKLFFVHNYYFDEDKGIYDEKYEEDFVLVHGIMKECMSKVNLNKILSLQNKIIKELLKEIEEVG